MKEKEVSHVRYKGSKPEELNQREETIDEDGILSAVTDNGAKRGSRNTWPEFHFWP